MRASCRPMRPTHVARSRSPMACCADSSAYAATARMNVPAAELAGGQRAVDAIRGGVERLDGTQVRADLGAEELLDLARQARASIVAGAAVAAARAAGRQALCPCRCGKGDRRDHDQREPGAPAALRSRERANRVSLPLLMPPPWTRTPARATSAAAPSSRGDSCGGTTSSSTRVAACVSTRSRERRAHGAGDDIPRAA